MGERAAHWMHDAACRGEDPDWWFPERGQNALILRAQRICARCAVREACAEYAISECIDIGIWGGLTIRDRIIERQRRRRGQAA